MFSAIFSVPLIIPSIFDEKEIFLLARVSVNRQRMNAPLKREMRNYMGLGR